MEQPLPSLLFVVESHKRFTRCKVSGAVPYIPRSFEKGHRKPTRSPELNGFFVPIGAMLSSFKSNIKGFFDNSKESY
jgi:hypothetical protein